MKRKNIYIAVLSLICCNMVYAQVPSKDSDTDTNIITHSIDNEGIVVKAGGRLSFDGAHYINDKTDMSSGVQIGEARLNMMTSFATKFDVKLDIDFARADVTFKDIYARWNISKNTSLRLGHYVMPFSLDKSMGATDQFFISKSATANSLSLGRRLGVSYRTYNNNLWAEVGAFGGDVYKKKSGDDAFGVSSRFVFNPQIGEDMVLHIGAGIGYRTPDANGIKDGDDDYNRYIRYHSNAETAIDQTNVLDANIEYASNEFKYNAELLFVTNKFFIQSEFTANNVSRKRNNQKLFEDQLGGMWSFQTLEAWEKWYGKDLRNVGFKGVSLQMGYLLNGGKYQYDRFNAFQKSSRDKGVWEIVVRYNHTNLNDVDGIWYNGKFIDPAKGIGADDPNFNYSIGGGILNSYTLGVNYYVNKYCRVMLNYGYQNIQSFTLNDTYAHNLQSRVQISF